MTRARGSSTVGYARVSSIPQHTQLQRDALARADCIRVFEEQVSSRAKDRPGLLKALDYLRAGDTLCVWKLDRLGRSVPRKSLPSPTTCTSAVSACAS